MATRVDVGPGNGGRVDVRRMAVGSGEGARDGERLPWLEAVEDEDEIAGPGAAKLIGSILVGLAAVGAIVGGSFWLGNRGADGAAGGGPELILAEPGPYKVKPEEPGGMAVEGRGDTAFATSEGADPQAKIDLSAVPEAPVTVAPLAPARGAEAAPRVAEPKAAEPITPVVPSPTAPAPTTFGAASVQLGAFSSNASAEAAWKALAGRFATLAPLGHSVQGATVNGRSVFRLRANLPDRAAARELCGRLAVAGESCVVL